MRKIYNLILASGSGTRLYPLSTKEKPKQFLELINEKMLVINTLERYQKICDKSFVLTLEKYKKFVENKVDHIIYEEKKRETAFSVYRFLEEIETKYENDCIIIQTPSDHFIIENGSFYRCMEKGIEGANNNEIVMIGATPFYAESEYGHIKNGEKMIEKPCKAIAEKLMAQGYVWNTGIYIYKAKTMRDYFNRFFYYEEKSFERTILVNVENPLVIVGQFEWCDIGNFKRLENTLKKMSK